ncbi:MAG: histidine kinase [Clostridiales bacterium]|nr:histidine kinase [Clostridiales bacterium]
MYVFCVIIPLVITDVLVLQSVYSQEYNAKRYELDSIASKYIANMQSTIDYNVSIARAISNNAQLVHFLDHSYENAYDYFLNYNDYISQSFFKTLVSTRSDTVTIYADNSTISDGHYFKPMSKAADTEWYRRFLNLDSDEALMIYFDETVDSRIEKRQKILFVKRIRFYDSKCDKIVKIEINASDMRTQLQRISSEYPMYICCGDYVVFARAGEALRSINVTNLENMHKMTVHHVFMTHGTTLDVYVFSDDLIISSVLRSNLWIIIVLIIVTLVLPVVIMKIIEKSLATRITKLGRAFSGNKENKFLPIQSIEGSDEISQLMINYNTIVSINNDLINSLYKDRLKERENDLSRKNAELLALQSQINPHFLFNSLESIRMHSILKGEDETAEMVEKLAVMTRQNVEWGNDLVTIKKETESIEAYLYLQSYRFGDRLSFDINVEKECESYLIPKLTLVTFVENACVHGIESKSSAGWIFVRVYSDENELWMEIEDTGGGMQDDDIAELLKSIENVSIDHIKGKKHVGILNACLRMKMHSENTVKIAIESEEGVGMSVVIRVPLDKLRRQGEKEQ